MDGGQDAAEGLSRCKLSVPQSRFEKAQERIPVDSLYEMLEPLWNGEGTIGDLDFRRSWNLIRGDSPVSSAWKKQSRLRWATARTTLTARASRANGNFPARWGTPRHDKADYLFFFLRSCNLPDQVNRPIRGAASREGSGDAWAHDRQRARHKLATKAIVFLKFDAKLKTIRHEQPNY